MTRIETIHLTIISKYYYLKDTKIEDKTDAMLDASGPASSSGQAFAESSQPVSGAAPGSANGGARVVIEAQADAPETTAELIDEAAAPNPSFAPSCLPENAADREFLVWEKKVRIDNL